MSAAGSVDGLQHRERTSRTATREGIVETRDLIRAERKVTRSGIVGHVVDVGRFGNHERARPTQKVAKGYLARGCIELAGYFREDAALGSLSVGKVIMPERTVTYERGIVLGKPGDDGMLDGPFAEMVKHLIADGAALVALA